MQLDHNISAVVTGGASGLGKASAQALAAVGVKVAIFDLNEEGGNAVAKEIGGTFHKVNVMDEANAEAGFAAARAANGQERILVHCAMAAKGGRPLPRIAKMAVSSACRRRIMNFRLSESWWRLTVWHQWRRLVWRHLIRSTKMASAAALP